MVGSIIGYITLNRNEFTLEMQHITQNTANVSLYKDWHHENNIYYKNVPEFLSYSSDKITCDRELLNLDKDLSNVIENRRYCYFSD